MISSLFRGLILVGALFSFTSHAMKSVMIFVCFDGENVVKTPGREKFVMDLQSGDEVVVGYDDEGQPRYGVIEAVEKRQAEKLLTITIFGPGASHQHVLSVTPNHVVYASTDSEQLRVAQDLSTFEIEAKDLTDKHHIVLNGKVGDVLAVSEEVLTVARDVYSPITQEGSIEVSGMLCSCKTKNPNVD